MSAAEAMEWKGKGNAALKTKDFDEAIRCYTKAIELDGTQHAFYSNRSAAYMSKGDAENALADGNKCIEVKPDWAKGYGRKGAALFKLGRLEEASAAYQAGLKVDASNAALKEGAMSVARALQTKQMSKQFEGLFDEKMWAKLDSHPSTKEHLKDEKFVAKMTQLQQNPDLVMQYMQAQDRQVMEAVSLLMQIKNYDPEKEARQKAEKEEADRIRKKKWEEKRAAEKKAKEEAEEAARRAAETPEERAAREKKELAEATKQEGNGHYKKREFAEALDKYADALELDPSNMSISTNRAAVFYEMKDYDKCLEECDKAIEIGRKYFCKFTLIAKAFARKGNAYMKKNMLDEAIENFENAQMESRTDAVKQKLKKCYKQKKLVEDAAYLNPEEGLKAKERGNELFKKGDFPGAIKEYSDAIKRDPESHVYYANRAAAYQKVMDFSSAHSDVDKALKIDPTYVKAWGRKGDIHFFLKEYHKAMEAYARGLENDETNQQCLTGLQRTQYKIQADAQSGKVDKERARRGMQDPEVRRIMNDPKMQSVLQEMQRNPAAAQRYMQDPVIVKGLNTLMAAGVLSMGGGGGQ